MGQARTVHIIQHLEHIPAGYLADYLISEGTQVNLIRAWELDGTCFSNALSKVKTTDSLVVLGGSMNAYADTEYPWLKAVRELLVRRPREKWVTAEDKLAKPTSETESAGKTLGICLGHQLAAVAFGGSVEVGALQPARKINHPDSMAPA